MLHFSGQLEIAYLMTRLVYGVSYVSRSQMYIITISLCSGSCGAVQVQAAERRASEAEARARGLQQQLANARRSAQSAAASAQEELDALSVRPIHPITHTYVSELAQSRRFPAHMAEYVAVSYAGTWR
jgi:hypothetical protein